VTQLSEQHGLDTYLHFLRRLIIHSQARLSSNASASSLIDTSINLTYRLLVLETQRISRDPFLADRFREAIDKGEGDTFRHFDLVRFCDRIGLRPLEKLVIASGVLSMPTRKELHNQANIIVRLDWDNAMAALRQHPCFDHSDLGLHHMAKFMGSLLADVPREHPSLDSNQRHTLITVAKAKFGSENIVPILRQVFLNLV
jgi:CCR4-NOT transcription complex subunit 1